MKARIAVVAAAGAVYVGLAHAQSMFRGDAAHAGVYRDAGPREFHRVKWSFPTGDRIVSSPVYKDGVVYFGGDDGNVYAVNAADGRQVWKRRTGGPVPSTPAMAGDTLYVGSYDGKFYALDARTGATRWKFATGGERRFEAKGLHGMQPKNQTIPDAFDVYLSSPVVATGAVYFGSGDGNVYALDAATGALKWKFQTGDVVHASPAYADGLVYFGSWDSYFYAVDADTGTEKWRFHGGEDPLIHNQVGFQSSPAVVNGVVYTGCRDSNLYALDAATGQGEVALQRERQLGDHFARGHAGQGDLSARRIRASISCSMPRPASRSCRNRATRTSSPRRPSPATSSTSAFSTARSRRATFAAVTSSGNSGPRLSRRNDGWVLTAERKFNTPMIFPSSWREAPIVGTDRQFGIGAIFSSPLVVGGVVYFGSTDGNLYALE